MYKIELGRDGPTDCCLRLINPQGAIREYYTESTGWIMLSHVWSAGCGRDLDDELGDYIWYLKESLEGEDYEVVRF